MEESQEEDAGGDEDIDYLNPQRNLPVLNKNHKIETEILPMIENRPDLEFHNNKQSPENKHIGETNKTGKRGRPKKTSDSNSTETSKSNLMKARAKPKQKNVNKKNEDTDLKPLDGVFNDENTVTPKEEDEEDEEGEFHCNKCKFVANKKSKLRSHQARMHSKPTTCDICSKVFITSD